MHALIQERREEIAAICRRHGVRRLEVFGSAARGDDFDPAVSDVDFLLEIDPERGSTFSMADYFDLRDELAQALDRPVDLVFPDSVRNPYVRADIEHSREVVHAA